MTADDKKLFFITSEIVDTVYSICFTLLQFIENKKIDPIYRESVQKLLNEHVLYIFSNSSSGALESNQADLYEKIQSWVTVVGLYIACFETWQGFPEATINKLLELGNSTLKKSTFVYEGRVHTDRSVLHDVEEIYRTLGLCLYWEFTLLQSIPLRKQVLIFLVRNRHHFEERYSSGDKYLPKSMIPFIGSWSLEQPFCPYYPYIRDNFAYLLSVYEPMKSRFIYYYMRKQELYLQLIDLINFKLRKDSSYIPFDD